MKHRYFYIPSEMRIQLDAEPIQDFVEIKHGCKTSDGKTIVDDRERSPYQLYQNGEYDPKHNHLLSNVVLNPLIYL